MDVSIPDNEGHPRAVDDLEVDGKGRANDNTLWYRLYAHLYIAITRHLTYRQYRVLQD